ncbi:MAG: hypothetical protein WCI74_15770, partial [Actinomycetes bacterium]
MKKNVKAGQIDKILADLAELRKSLGAARSEAGEVPGLAGKAGAAQVEQAISDTMTAADKFAKTHGMTPWRPPSSGSGTGAGGTGGTPGPGGTVPSPTEPVAA